MAWYDPTPMTDDEAVAIMAHLDAETAAKAREYACANTMPYRDELPLLVKAAAPIYYGRLVCDGPSCKDYPDGCWRCDSGDRPADPGCYKVHED